MRAAAMLRGRAGARSSSLAEPPPADDHQGITRALEDRLACSATKPWTVAGQVVSMRDDQGDEIAAALDLIRRAEYSAGPPCVG